MPAILPATLDPLEPHEIPAEYDLAGLRAFVEQTRLADGAELANSQKMFVELCVVLGVPEPGYKRAGQDNAYCFEEDVKADQAHRRIDVYCRGHFVFEAKQGVSPRGPVDAVGRAAKARSGHSKRATGAGLRGSAAWLEAMQAGRIQAGNYALWVSQRGDPKPPFIIVADMGHRFWVWSSFQPDIRDDYGDFDLHEEAAFAWSDLLRPEVFAFLRAIWTAPERLDQEAIGQRVTAEIAEKICDLAVRLERRASSEQVGDFLMKCVFTMFAEDIGLIPTKLFKRCLEGWIRDAQTGNVGTFVKGIRRLWTVMRDGGDLDSGESLKRFNGYLFSDPEPLPLGLDELELLHAAAGADWRKVSPAIFGTLLERALTPAERQRLGAHYTPEVYIRRLVERTVMRPLRGEWMRTRVEMDLIARTGAATRADGSVTNTRKPRKEFDAARALGAAVMHGHRFRRRLAGVTVLDPACGSGNFLYVALKEMKRLEGEVERTLLALQRTQNLWLDIDGESVRPGQFWGIEQKPWAAKVAELVLWIGYLQWQVSAGRLPRMREPLIQDLHHIETGDALIRWERREQQRGEDGAPALQAVGVTARRGARAMVPIERYVGVRVAPWPDAEFIVGNPPFLGNKRINDLLGAGYVDAIKRSYPGVGGGADLVMWWWLRAAELVVRGKTRRFGFVTTNSIAQTGGRGVVSGALAQGLRLVYAIADHPWYDEGAAVRIAMTVGTMEPEVAVVGEVVDESRTRVGELESVRVVEREVADIHADLSTGADVSAAAPLLANQGICFQGMNLVGDGFRLTPEELKGLGLAAAALPPVVRRYVIGRDLLQRCTERYVIDLHGLEADDARLRFPALWDHLVRHVRPARAANNRANYQKYWWLFGEGRPGMRRALVGLSRYIVTGETAKHRVFQFLPADTVADHKIYAIAADDAFLLGVLSSRVHREWALAAGGTLEDRPTWTSTTCFARFPFPDPSPEQRAAIARIAEAIDGHRKAVQRARAELGLTDLYNVIAALRAGRALTTEEEAVRSVGRVDTLLQLHEDLDAAVFAAYGWPVGLGRNELLARIVGLNGERAREEGQGRVRYLRREMQAPGGLDAGRELVLPARPGPVRVVVGGPEKWPAGAFERVGAVVRALRGRGEACGVELLAGMFTGAAAGDVLLSLQNAAAAQLVSCIDSEAGAVWIARS
ncbi:MAG: class I SAM-dependent DNA methyltransferase [Nannocystis sp.]|uniref:class I SAM-dependent DNA methyltransferase n=1 Tax=Nannocystis sp. TaxID=1962667 RepID=UPI0024288271|nr:DNA methyltransferase [Nannocystis sp.]MBK9752515.1 class I SAM-dependent DNA methyltransferase [Nannocystis sp.]